MPRGETDGPGAASGKSPVMHENLPPVPSQRGVVPLVPTARTGNKSTQWLTPDRHYGVRTSPTDSVPQIPSDIFAQMRDAVVDLASAQQQRTEALVREDRAKKALEDLLAEHPEVNFVQILSANIEGGGPFARTVMVTDPKKYEDEVPHALKLLSRRSVRHVYEVPFGLPNNEGNPVSAADIWVTYFEMLRNLGFTTEEIELLKAQGQITTDIVIRPPKQFVEQAEKGLIPGSKQYMEIHSGRRRIRANPINGWEENEKDDEI